MTDQRMIDANVLEKSIYDSGLWDDHKAKFCEWIDSAPTVPAVVLPCKVGDRVYTIGEDSFVCETCPRYKGELEYDEASQTFPCRTGAHCPLHINEHIVQGFKITNGDDGNQAVSGPGEWGHEGFEEFSGFDGKWYLTREEAEAALRRVENADAAD